MEQQRRHGRGRYLAPMMIVSLLTVMSFALATQATSSKIVVWDLYLTDNVAQIAQTEIPDALVFIQTALDFPYYDFNIHFWNKTPRDVDNLEVELDGQYEIIDTYNGAFGSPPQIVDDVGPPAKTYLTWTGATIEPGSWVHVGVRTSDHHAKVTSWKWTIGLSDAGALPSVVWDIEGVHLLLSNPGANPVVAANFRQATLPDPIDLTLLNLEGLEAAGITLTPLRGVGPFVIRPGDSADTGIRIAITEAPTVTQWGLIALGVLLAGSLAFMLRRRFRAQGSRA